MIHPRLRQSCNSLIMHNRVQGAGDEVFDEALLMTAFLKAENVVVQARCPCPAHPVAAVRSSKVSRGGPLVIVPSEGECPLWRSQVNAASQGVCVSHRGARTEELFTLTPVQSVVLKCWQTLMPRSNTFNFLLFFSVCYFFHSYKWTSRVPTAFLLLFYTSYPLFSYSSRDYFPLHSFIFPSPE